jgi:hypothetical protein
MAKVNSYQRGKENARNEAKKWQIDVADKDLSWWDVAHFSDYFEKIGKRFGLIREFRENGII